MKQQQQKTVWLLRMPVCKEDNGKPCLEVFVFDTASREDIEDIVENLSRYVETKGNSAGSYVLLDADMLVSTFQLTQKALADIEVPKDDDTIN